MRNRLEDVSWILVVVKPFCYFFIEGVADKLAKYFTGHLPALWHTFGCNFMGSMDFHYCSEHPRITLVQQQ